MLHHGGHPAAAAQLQQQQLRRPPPPPPLPPRPRAAARRAAAARPRAKSIRDFIEGECPVRGFDGVWRERARQPTHTASCIEVPALRLACPGQRRLLGVAEAQLDRIIADEGAVVLCSLQEGGRAVAAPPRGGSWACLARVAGLQRLPGGRALVRVLAVDRVAVQGLDCSSPEYALAQASLLRDRWVYMVRRQALEEHLASGAAAAGAGREVAGAVAQVQDASGELLSLVRQLADSVAAAADAGGELAGRLAEHEAADELAELAAWCAEVDAAGGGGGGSDPLEQAWRLSFAPFAATGLAAALRVDGGGPSVQGALQATDLGMRLEDALELAQRLHAALAAQLALSGGGGGGGSGSGRQG